jgi:hypothetical protein
MISLLNIEIPKKGSYNLDKSRSTEFEVLDASLHDYPEIRSLNLSPKLPERDEPKQRSKSRDHSVEKKREESQIEKLKNIGTNVRYELGTLYQKLMLYKRLNRTKSKECVLFGNQYDVYEGEESSSDFVKKYQEIIWFTYRKNFPILLENRLSPTDYYINDTGWGCMIRVCQMLLAETLKRTINDSPVIMPNVNLHERIISLFLDCQLIPQESPYSIQTICHTLLDEFKLKPGQWFKASSVFLALQQIHEKLGKDVCEKICGTNIALDIEVFLEGTIYLDKIEAYFKQEKEEYDQRPVDVPSMNYHLEFEEINEDLLNSDDLKPTVEKIHTLFSSAEFIVRNAEKILTPLTQQLKKTQLYSKRKTVSDNLKRTEEQLIEIFNNLKFAYESINRFKNSAVDKQNELPRAYTNMQRLLIDIKSNSEKLQPLIEQAQSYIEDAQDGNNKKVLVVVLTKIGLDSPNPEYFPCIKKYLEMPECVGMIGGRPGLAYYFVGFIENTLVYLDPHFVQESIHSKAKLKENLGTYSCKKHRIVDMSSIDTSVAFGFLISGYKKLKKFQQDFKNLAQLPNSFLGIEDNYPYYSDDSENEEDVKLFDDFEEL